MRWFGKFVCRLDGIRHFFFFWRITGECVCVCVLGYMFFVGQFIAWSERALFELWGER